MFTTIVAVIIVAVAVFVFVKNNPKKTKTIDQFVRTEADEFKDKLSEEARKIREKVQSGK